MAWEHCDTSIKDDEDLCPTCGITKAQWTVEWNVTRTFTIASSRKGFVRVSLVDGDDCPITGERFVVTAPDGSSTEGTLDDLGAARVPAPAVGVYLVAFPDRARGDLAREVEPEEAPGDGPDAEGRFPVERGRTLRLRLAGVFELDLHHLLDDPSTKDDRITLRSSEDQGAAYSVTRWLADPAQARPIGDGYLRIRFEGVSPTLLYDCEVDPGIGPDGEQVAPYLLFRRARLRGRTVEKPLSPRARDESADDGAPPELEPGEAIELAEDHLAVLAARQALAAADDPAGEQGGA